MIRINQLKLPVTHSAADLEHKIKKTLRLSSQEKFTYRIVRRSIDARKKPDIYYVYAVNVNVSKEEHILKKIHTPSVLSIQEKNYQYPVSGDTPLLQRPLIIGAGPAGLFCAYLLTEMGYEPLVIERGKKIEDRMEDVENFWKTGVLDPQSNVQFGEGGAGTFSDGKLNSAVKDPSGRNQFVLETFVRFGAPEQILYDNKPHIGTDILSMVIVRMRKYLEEKGCQFFFECCAKDFIIENGSIRQIVCDKKTFDVQTVVLALGHSSRDTFEKLYARHITMEVKNFAVGFRVEHPQSMIDQAMYGTDRFHGLPASPYKVTSNFPNGRGVYSFCMCPGGYVVNSSSEKEETVVNGMSYSGRNGQNANSAIIVSVTPADFGASDPLAGMRYQRRLEHAVYKLADGKIPQQLFGDYCNNVESHQYGDFLSSTKGAAQLSNLRGLISSDMEQSFIAGMQHFSHIIPGFDRADAILSGMETRTSSPVRINRKKNLESEIHGLYPCGEGAGYAGGIMSAAMDGMKVAEAIIQKYTNKRQIERNK